MSLRVADRNSGVSTTLIAIVRVMMKTNPVGQLMQCSRGNRCRHSGARLLARARNPSHRDHCGPMDSGFVLRAPRNDEGENCGTVARRARLRFTPTPNQWLKVAVPFRQEGRIAIVTNAGRDVVDARASARMAVAGRVLKGPVSGSRRRATTNDVSSVRQNRVVLTPVAGAKSAVTGLTRPGRSVACIRRRR